VSGTRDYVGKALKRSSRPSLYATLNQPTQMRLLSKTPLHERLKASF
jgi:hypothetical protein